MVRTLTPARPRDASQTRRELLNAARVRFARDGYRSTTVRDIATDAGVNVALINRYFESKERLFEACIARVGEELATPVEPARTSEELARRLVVQIMGFSSEQGPAQLLLLLRRSGDERADEIRRTILRSFAEKMAAIAGWTADSDDRLLLRAEIIMAATLGIIQLRATSGIEPLGSAAPEDLARPIEDMVVALLSTGS